MPTFLYPTVIFKSFHTCYLIKIIKISYALKLYTMIPFNLWGHSLESSKSVVLQGLLHINYFMNKCSIVFLQESLHEIWNVLYNSLLESWSFPGNIGILLDCCGVQLTPLLFYDSTLYCESGMFIDFFLYWIPSLCEWHTVFELHPQRIAK